MQKYSYYPESDIIEEVVTQLVGKATVQEARQADMKKFGLLKNQVCYLQAANCCRQSWLLSTIMAPGTNCFSDAQLQLSQQLSALRVHCRLLMWPE